MAAIESTDVFRISRVLEVPREKMWRAWTEESQLKNWFGPKGVTIEHAKLDLRPGGTFHYQFRLADGKEMWGKFIYREIEKPSQLVWVNTFSDAAGGMTRHPFAPNWPQQMLTAVQFQDLHQRTVVSVDWEPIMPNEAELVTFQAGYDSMKMGWTGTFEQLADYLSRA